MAVIEYGFGTDTGLRRQCNEDSLLIAPELGLWAVADGMGGHASGDVASAIVVRELSDLVSQGMGLAGSIRLVHQRILKAASRGEGGADMGSTVVAAKLDGLRYEIAWVGDSRAYLWDGRLRQITRDHSYVQLLLDAGLIEEAEAANHPYRNVISQALGGNDKSDVQVDQVSGELAPGEALLLCSDGLSGELSEAGLAEILGQAADNQTRVDRLIDAARKAGGRDNITVIVLSPAAPVSESVEERSLPSPARSDEGRY